MVIRSLISLLTASSASSMGISSGKVAGWGSLTVRGLIGAGLLLVDPLAAPKSIAGVPLVPTARASSPPVLQPRPIAKPTSQPTFPPKLQPFFDRTLTLESVSFPRTQGVDVTPIPPVMTDFDRAVLKTCGSFGRPVSAEKVRQLFRQHPQVVAAIQAAVNGNLNPQRNGLPLQPSATFQEDLIDVWMSRNGFEHIFCGQVNDFSAAPLQIGGLHFAPRYYELQQQGIAGRLAKNQPAEEVIPGLVYTIGVEIKLRGQQWRDRKKGYSPVRDAQEILIDATRAYKAFKINSGANAAVCSYRSLEMATAEQFNSVLVKNDRSIITFYPDATPEPGERSCGESAVNSGVNLDDSLNSDNSLAPVNPE